MFIGIPVSSKGKEDFYRFPFKLLEEKSIAKLSQIRSFDKKRCIRLMMMLSKKDLDSIILRVIKLFNKDETPPIKVGNLGCPKEKGDNTPNHISHSI